VPSFWAAATSASMPPPAAADCAVAQATALLLAPPELLPVFLGLADLLELEHAASVTTSEVAATAPKILAPVLAT
jgi:hypothetical protein